ncbi:cupin domain-containing protein [Croceitalea marina]|uniref:Cupin domain-containing protein n=1 Tax=Croceitalea marina TaxID=1775166 RepID=A0ABW5N0J5_9FLAO
MKTIKIFSIIILYGFFTMSISANEICYTNSDCKTKKSFQTKLKEEVHKIIVSYVNDYKNDRHASKKRVIGIEVPEVDGAWTVTVTGQRLPSKNWEVNLKEGLPKIPTYAYSIELETLKAIYNGKINALTAQGKAFGSDYTPMSVREINAYEPSTDDDHHLNAFSFHFWTKGFPEIIPFHEGATRKVHGSNATVFYYEKGLRTAWYSVASGDKVRHDPREQANPFPMMCVMINGTIQGEVDGEHITVSAGNTIFIPANVTHKWWNESDKPAEAILIMFGEGA